MTIGKLYSLTDATKLYGPVTYSVNIYSVDLQALLPQTSDYIMFDLINNNLVVTDNKRLPLLPANIIIPKTHVMNLFSIDMIEELLQKGNDAVTHVEKRHDVLTITNGDYTLEQSAGCPPYCY